MSMSVNFKLTAVIPLLDSVQTQKGLIPAHVWQVTKEMVSLALVTIVIFIENSFIPLIMVSIFKGLKNCNVIQ
jgi:hypothetical protein